MTPGKKIDLKVYRYSKGEYVKGVWADGINKIIEIKANVQPLSSQELLLFAEGSRRRHYVKVYSDDELVGIDEDTEIIPDEFIYEGKRFQIQEVKHYNSGILPHYKSIAAQLNTRK